MTIRRMPDLKSSIAIVALLALVTTFALLGRWQLTRAEVNRALEARYVEYRQLPALDGPVATSDLASARWRGIAVSGSYHPEIQVLLDNMTRDGIVGYEVLTPFLATGDRRALLINRGWVAADLDRSKLPPVGLDHNITQLSGIVDNLPRAEIQLGESLPQRSGSLVVLSFPDAEAIEAALGVDVYGYQILLDSAEPAGFERNWPPPQGRAERNLAYAVQWFALACLAAVLAVGAIYRARCNARDQRA